VGPEHLDHPFFLKSSSKRSRTTPPAVVVEKSPENGILSLVVVALHAVETIPCYGSTS
jgi:hypothetical protein